MWPRADAHSSLSHRAAVPHKFTCIVVRVRLASAGSCYVDGNKVVEGDFQFAMVVAK